MHPTALENAKHFFDIYIANKSPATVLDIGAQDVNGSLRQVCPPNAQYIGVDFIEGKGVDVVLQDPYALPFADNSQDVIVSSSCFEHSEMFWVLFLEILRVMKPHGLFYLNVPSNGEFHRYPVDCWRFYPDAGKALVCWAERNGFSPQLLEAYTTYQMGGVWNDFVAIYVKDKQFASTHRDRVLPKIEAYANGTTDSTNEILKPQSLPEDMRKLAIIRNLLNGQLRLF